MKFSIVDVMAATALIAILIALAKYMPDVFLYVVLLVHVAQVTFPFMLLVVAIAFSEQKNAQLDITSNTTLKMLTRIWKLSLAVVICCWLVLAVCLSF